MNRINELHRLGQSIWYDNIQRGLIEDGTLARLLKQDEIRGITSNPSIFNHAISHTKDYDGDLLALAQSGMGAEQILTHLVIDDIKAAADLFLPLYLDSRGGDGYVSLEVSPELAYETRSTIAEARHLWEAVQRPNLMIKIPATKDGIAAVEECIFQGINVNVTLIFSLVRYEEVLEAYIRGLERRIRAGLPVDTLASVASFFISRVDTKVDGLLQKRMEQGGPQAIVASQQLGKAAIANARLAYELSLKTFSTTRFQHIQVNGGRIQRPLWASTSTKNPAYSDVKYVDELIGPDTINTVPPQTLDAFRDHGTPCITLTTNLEDAQHTFTDLITLGIDMAQVTDELEREGVKAFADAYQALLKTIDNRTRTAFG